MRGAWVSLCILVFLALQANAAVNNFIKNCTDCEIVTGAWPTRTSAVMATDDGRVWRSTDEGQTWTQMLRWLKISNIAQQNSTTLYFFPWSGTNLVYSIDGGATLINATLPVPMGQIKNIQPHPTNNGWLMLGTCGISACSMYTTKNFGLTTASWTGTFINGLGPGPYIMWGNSTSQPDLTFAIKSDATFGFTTNYGSSWTPILTNAAGFVQTQHYVFVGVTQGASVKLYASSSRVDPSHRSGYAQAEFPSGSTITDDYVFLDDVTRAEFLGVHPKNPQGPQPVWGSVFTSEFDGAYYQMAIDHVYYDDSTYDFHRFNGLAGIYLANIVANWEIPTPVIKKMTVVTWDNGGDWRFLSAPKTDMNGNPWSCSFCPWLHIHAESSSWNENTVNPNITFPGWRTHASAIGIIFANGNVGPYLSYSANEVSTFLSRDAGLTWSQIYPVPTVYEFGDHGGILLMAPAFTPVTYVLYSYDQGVTFQQLTFTNVPMTVSSIITEPGGTGEKFIVNAWTGNDIASAKWSIFGIDLSDLPLRTCGPDDFEQFIPVNPEEDQACFMGAVTTYTRRNRTSSCYNVNPNTDQPITQTPCACQWEDYECDYNYASSWRNSTDGFNCTIIYVAPDQCADGSDYYWKQTGYALVPDTMCDPTASGALNLVAPKISCHGSTKKNGAEVAAAVIVTLLIIGSIVGVGVLYWKNERFHAWVQSLKPSSTSQRYSVVHQDEQDEDNS